MFPEWHPMTPKEITSEELRGYLERHPKEQQDLAALRAQLSEETFGQIVARSNMRGHLTSSALVLDPAKCRVLLVFHLIANRWLQPGGHVELATGDGSASFLATSALREVAEETGVVHAELTPVHGGRSSLLDIDTHAIKANPKKNEGDHAHHDFLYLAAADSDAPLTAQESEVSCARWAELGSLKDISDSRLARVYQKLVQLGYAH